MSTFTGGERPDGAPHVTPLGVLHDPGHEVLVTGGHAGTNLAASKKSMPGRDGT